MVIHIQKASFCAKFLVGLFPVLSRTPRNHKKNWVVFTVISPNPWRHSLSSLHIYWCNTLFNIYLFCVYTIIILAFSRSLCECSTDLETFFFSFHFSSKIINFENEVHILYFLAGSFYSALEYIHSLPVYLCFTFCNVERNLE